MPERSFAENCRLVLDIMDKPTKAKLPHDLANRMRVVLMLGELTTEKKFSGMLTYVKRLDRMYQMVFLRMAIRQCPMLANHIDVQQWMSDPVNARFTSDSIGP